MLCHYVVHVSSWWLHAIIKLRGEFCLEQLVLCLESQLGLGLGLWLGLGLGLELGLGLGLGLELGLGLGLGFINMFALYLKSLVRCGVARHGMSSDTLMM